MDSPVTNIKHRNLKKLFDKEMNRKQFLAHVGAGGLAILGISGLIKTLISFDAPRKQHIASGYGSSAYGGSKK